MDKGILRGGGRLGRAGAGRVALRMEFVHRQPRLEAEEEGGAAHHEWRQGIAIVATLRKGAYLEVGYGVISRVT